MTALEEESILTVALMNIHGQSGLNHAKQMQIETFLSHNDIDVLHLQEIDIVEDTFRNCNFISSSYNILTNNSPTKYGTASLVKSDLYVENIVCDTEGRALIFDIGKFTHGNVYLPFGTDARSRTSREQYCSETLP